VPDYRLVWGWGMSSTDEVSTHADFAGVHALSSRAPGYAVALKCLEVQAQAESRDSTLRTAARVTLHPDAWPWYTGALGEIEVGRLLSALGPEWFVRHAVPIGEGTKDVDHLVIGPRGVFAINTKHHRGASIWVGDYVLRVNNANTHHVNAAQGDGVDVARRLTSKVGFPVPVTSVIAVLHAKSLVDGRAPENRRVAVVEAQHLARWLAAQPPRFDDAQLSLIVNAAEEPQTWHSDPHAADTLRVLQRFDRLVAQVGNARPPKSAKTVGGADRDHSSNADPAGAPSARSTASRRRTRTSTRTSTRRPARTVTAAATRIKLWLAPGAVLVSIAWLYGVLR